MSTVIQCEEGDLVLGDNAQRFLNAIYTLNWFMYGKRYDYFGALQLVGRFVK